MAVFKAIGKGFTAACRKPRILADLWVINFLFSAMAAAPFIFLIQRDLGHSILGEKLRSVDFLWLGEAVFKYGNAAPAVVGGALAVVLSTLLLYAFLNGGIIGRLLDKEGSSKLGAFFADGGRYFWRFFGLFLLSLPFYAVAFGVLLSLFSALVGAWDRNATTEWTPLILSNLRFLFALALLTLVQLVFDYAKIITVAEDDHNVFHALRSALAFLGKRFFRSWGLFLMIALIPVVGTALFIILSGLLPGTGLVFPAIGIGLMQLYFIFRLWGKMLFFSAQAEYYRLSHY